MFLTKPILLVLTLTALVSAERFFGGFGPFGSNGAKEQNNGGGSTTTVSVPTSTVGQKCPEAKYCICERKCGGLGSAEKNTTATSAISSTPTTASNSNAPTSPSTVSETSSTVSEASSTVSSTEASSTVSSTGISSTHKNKKSGELGEENHDEEEWHGLPPQVRKRWLALHGRKHLEQQPAAGAGEQNCKMECKCISVPKFSAESEEKSAEHIKGSGEKKAGGGNTGCDYKNKGMQRADCKNARVQKQQKGIVSPINNNPHEQERVKMGNNGILPPQKLDNRGCDHLNEGAQRENCKNARVQEQKQMQIWNKFNRPN